MILSTLSMDYVAQDLQRWRTSILQGVLYALVIFAGSSLVVEVVDSMIVDSYTVVVWEERVVLRFYVATYIFTILLTLLRRLPFWFRSMATLMILCGLGLINLYFFGLSLIGPLFLFTTIVLVMLLHGWRWSIATMTVAFTAMMVIAISPIIPWLTFPFEQRLASHSQIFVDVVVAFLFLVMLVIVPTGYLLRSLEQSLQRSTEAAKELDQANVLLEQRVAERTAQLAVAIRESEQAQLQEQVIEAQRAALRELSTPLIPIAEHVVVMPLIGAIDSTRAQQVLEALLEGTAEHRATIAILDITGVPVVDTQVAQVLISAAEAVKLLGARVILTGIQPAMAQTMVHLGIDLSGVTTRGSLQDGIMVAFQGHNGGNGVRKPGR